ncbi:hypothetical protein PGH26_08495 [Sporosarcina jeotgali]|uniref:Uncharacterized protein n=1 Tax=Sporosarcina jeotgali TaxID=3020056 RepID=A0ABZ0KT30_9BACL|nr:hypothetical protein [Sporosarcina sp. B2O-1]WOV82982.1 hypothetical protein PGH26_08495 [Sporosarcina sp. B2O-1]
MKKGSILFSIGFVLFLTGIIVSAFLSAGWIIIGTVVSMMGGGLIGISSNFFVFKGRGIQN